LVACCGRRTSQEKHERIRLERMQIDRYNQLVREEQVRVLEAKAEERMRQEKLQLENLKERERRWGWGSCIALGWTFA
jgi:hypothetical protein